MKAETIATVRRIGLGMEVSRTADKNIYHITAYKERYTGGVTNVRAVTLDIRITRQAAQETRLQISIAGKEGSNYAEPVYGEGEQYARRIIEVLDRTFPVVDQS